MEVCSFCQLFSALTSLMQVQMEEHLRKGHQQEKKHECNCSPLIGNNNPFKDAIEYKVRDESKESAEIEDKDNIVDEKIEVNFTKLSQDNSIIKIENSELFDYIDLRIKGEGIDIDYDHIDDSFDEKNETEDSNVNDIIKIHDESSKQIRVKKDYSCGECADIFSRFKDLKVHSKDKHFRDIRKTSSEKLTCDICFKQYPGITRLLNHKKIHMDGRVKKYMCDECSKTFFTPGALNQHKLRHSGENQNVLKTKLKKSFFCDECGKSFTGNNNLKDHKLRKHSEIPQIKPYNCDNCKRYFLTFSELRKHEGVHTDERPFSCNECSKTFRRSHALVIHERIHTGERPYQCGMCEKAFVSSPRLIAHKRVHTGEKPYSCFKCLAAFSQSGNLKTHIKTCKINN